MAQDYEIGLVVNEIRDLTNADVAFGGSGRGQTATVQWASNPTITLSVIGTSRLNAVTALLEQVKAENAQIALGARQMVEGGEVVGIEIPAKRVDPQAGRPRPTVEDALDRLMRAFGEFDVDEEDEDNERTPGPVWKGTRLIRIVPCVGECMAALPSSPCDCRCDGANHAIGGVVMLDLFTKVLDPTVEMDDKARAKEFKSALKSARPVVYGPKPCMCGCGGITQRRFVPGHDARYHARLKREAKEREAKTSATA